jgi:hypothetical protein
VFGQWVTPPKECGHCPKLARATYMPSFFIINFLIIKMIKLHRPSMLITKTLAQISLVASFFLSFKGMDVFILFIQMLKDQINLDAPINKKKTNLKVHEHPCFFFFFF